MIEAVGAGAATLPYAKYERVRFPTQLFSDLATFSQKFLKVRPGDVTSFFLKLSIQLTAKISPVQKRLSPVFLC